VITERIGICVTFTKFSLHFHYQLLIEIVRAVQTLTCWNGLFEGIICYTQQDTRTSVTRTSVTRHCVGYLLRDCWLVGSNSCSTYERFAACDR
jgi:hypothetical protein